MGNSFGYPPLFMKEEMNNIVFHYNTHRKLWSAFERKNWAKYWNDFANCKKVSAKKLPVLIDYVNKYGILPKEEIKPIHKKRVRVEFDFDDRTDENAL